MYTATTAAATVAVAAADDPAGMPRAWYRERRRRGDDRPERPQRDAHRDPPEHRATRAKEHTNQREMT